MRVLLPAIVIVFVAFLATQFTSDKSAVVFLDNLYWTVANVAAAWLAWIGVRSAAPTDRATRRWIAIGLTSYAVGEILFDVQVALAWNPFPAPTDFFFLCLGPCTAIGLVKALPAETTYRQRCIVTLDALALSFVVLAIALALYLPRRAGIGTGPIAVMTAYPLSLLGAASIAIILVPTLRARFDAGWAILISALILKGVLWMRWNTLALDHTLEDGTLFNVLFTVAALATGLGALRWRILESDEPSWDRKCEGVLRLLPLMAVMGAAAALILAWSVPGQPRVAQYTSGIAAILVTTLALARQIVLLRERDQLLEVKQLAQESRLNWKTLFETAQDGIFIMNDRVFTDCNPSVLTMFGCRKSQIVGSTPLDFSPEFQPDGQRSDEKARELIAGALSGHPQFFEWKHRTLTGTEFDAEVRLNRLERDGGDFMQATVRDITARKRTENDVQHSFSLITATLEATADGILVVDAAGKILRFNQKFVDMWRIPTHIVASRDDNVALSFVLDQLSEPEAFLKKVRELYEQPEADSFDTLEFKDGRAFERYSHPQRLADLTIGRVWSFRDITARNKAETALRASEQQYRTLVQRMGEGLLMVDRADTIQFSNQRFSELTGYTVEELVGQNASELLLDPEERERMKLRNEGRSSGAIESYEIQLRHRAGKLIWCRITASPLYDANGVVTGSMALVADITETRRAQEELHRREERFRLLIENASDIITVIDGKGIISFQSPSSERILGYTERQILGRSAFEFIHPDDAKPAAEILQRALQNPAAPVSVEFRIRRKDGDWRILQSVGRSIPGLLEEGFIVFNSRDVTANRELEEQFRQSQKMEAIGRLSGGVAHDFNNLLTIIRGHVALFKLNEELSAELRDSAEEIDDAATRAANLTRQLLTFSRRQAMCTCDLDLNEVVAKTSKMLQRIVGEDIHMQVKCSPTPQRVMADEGMMDQILLNLAVNSRDAMPSGGNFVIETSEVELDEISAAQLSNGRPGRFVSLSVSDNGCGIPRENLTRIFEPFFTTKGVGKGTGLGLATVYGAVQQHQGWINIYSEVGVGTTFRIYLPSLTTGDAPKSSVDAELEATGGSETILVVEDEPALRQLVRKILLREGYHVLEASSGLSALHMWDAHKDEVQLLLTDLVMPDGVSGHELARRLLATKPHLKVIYTSGYSPELAVPQAESMDPTMFIQKPYNPQRLIQIVRACLDQR